MESGDANARRDERIYSQRLKMLLKSAIKEERYSNLTVDADLQSCNGGLFRKEFMIRITDEEDPLFFYHMRLNDDDYQALRQQQGLLVDFIAFPQKFVDLLEMCHQEETNRLPRFVLQLMFSQINDGTLLNIVEVNAFKHLVHLSLKLNVGTDNEVKRFLASYLKSVKSRNNELQNQLQSTESELSSRLRDCKEQMSEKSRILERLQNELRDQATNLQNRLEQQVSREKDRVQQLERNLRDKHERELGELESAHRQLICRLESNLASLNAQAGDLGVKHHHAESAVHELRNRVDSSERELQSLRHESHELKRDNAHLLKSRDEWERGANQMSSRLAALEQDVRERDTQLARQQMQIDSFAEQKAALTSELGQKQALISKRTDSIKTLSEELNKGNDIIRKLQNEIRSLQSKVKLRNQVTLEQEKVVTEKEKQVEVLQSRLLSLEERINQHENEEKRLQESLKDAQTKLEDNSKVMKTNENVINWLNKQLNDAQSNQRKTTDNNNNAGAGPLGALGSQVANLFATSTPMVAAVGYTPPTSSGNPGASDRAHSAMRRSPFSAIPEESNIPFAAATSGADSGTENNPPLDPKYFRARGSEPRAPGSTPPAPSSGHSRPRTFNNVRLPRTSIAPLASSTKSTNSRGSFPLSSAYFQP